MAYCSQCGKQISGEANYCRHCGSITRTGKTLAALDYSGPVPELAPAPVTDLPTTLSENAIRGLGKKLQTLLLAEVIPFQRGEIITLGNLLEEDERLLEALSVQPDGLVVATTGRIICLRREPPTLALATTVIEDPDIEAIGAREIGNSIRIRLTCRNSRELSFLTTDKGLARDFIELVEFTISIYSDDDSESFDFEARHPVEYSRAAEAAQKDDETQDRNESLESLKLLLAVSMPLVIMYLKHKQASGEAPTIVGLASKVGIPAMAVPMLMPLLQEKLTELLGENHNLPLLK